MTGYGLSVDATPKNMMNTCIDRSFFRRIVPSLASQRDPVRVDAATASMYI
jgi:hypothetical protein